MNKIYTLWMWACLLPLFSFSQAVEIDGELKQWHKVSLSFQGPQTAEQDTLNPFTDYRLTVTFSNSNHSITIPGYYAADGNAAETSADTGSVWRVHFVPIEVGTWTYEVSFRQGTNIAVDENPLAGVSTAFDSTGGSLEILPSDKSGDDLRAKGLLNYVGEHYLQFAGSKEYFIKGGANSPENLLGYFEFDNTEDFGGVETPGLVDGLHQYPGHVVDWNEGDPVWQETKGKGLIGALNYLASQGVNSIYFLTYNTDAGDGQDTYMWVSPDNKLIYDCSKLDQWEIVFKHADKLGLQLHIITQETENNTAMNSLSLERKLYYRELIARFGHHLAIQWNIGEENSNTDEDRILFANYIRQHDPYNHPIAIHSVYDEASTYYDGLLGELSYEATSIQGIGTRYNEWSQELRERSALAGRKWVIYGDEQAPEVKPDLSNLTKLRRIYWETLLGGGGGCEWYFGYQDTFGDVQSEDFRGVEVLWQQTTLARRFWQEYVPFFEMEPNDALVQGNTKAMHKDSGLFVVYIPAGSSTQLDISGATDSLSVFWFNPRTGGDIQMGSVANIFGEQWVDIGTPPSETDQDWVAIIGNGNRAPRFVMQPDQLNLNMNFEGTVSAIPEPAPTPESELTQTIVYHINPDTVTFATMDFDTNTGEVSFTALPDMEGEQVFTITANDGQEFNNTYAQPFTLRVSPPTPPSASFTASILAGYAPLNVQFDAGESFDANGNIISYAWNFDAVNSGTGEVINHTFENIGTFNVQLIITDEDGMKDTAYQSILVEEMPMEMLFVANQMDLNEGDLLLKERLEQAGYTVIVKDQQSAISSDANNKALVLISSSVSSSAVNTKFTNVSTPVVIWESYLFDDMGMTPGGNGTGFGSEYGDNNIAITDDSHFLAAGLSGTQLLLSSGSGLNWGNPSNEAIVIGTVPGEGDKSLLFAYDEGANMASGTAQARRVGVFIRDNTATGLTAEALELFDAAVCWAISCPASNPVNQAPTISPITAQTNEQGETISLQVNANDPEGDQITFSGSGLPNGLTLDTSTGLISGTITAIVGTYNVSITATDNGSPNESSSISFSWEVIEPIPNQAPILSAVPNQSDEQGQVVNLQITAVDPEGDNITFGATGLPQGLTINSNTGLISGTVTAVANTYAVTITATDDGDPNESASVEFDWTVVLPPPNQAPTITPIANQSHAQQSVISLQVLANDPDGDDLQYVATNLPTGLAINSQTGLISGIISANVGVYNVEIMVSDDGSPALSAMISFDWEVFMPLEPLETIWLEAECANFGGDWTSENDGSASGGKFLSTQSGFVNDANINTNHIIDLQIQAEEAGIYAVWMRIKTSSGFNSLWQQNGNGWAKLDFGNLSNWTWVQVEDISLGAGSNSVQFAKREGALIDKWVVSKENGFSPNGVGDADVNCNSSNNNPPVVTPIANQTNDPGANIGLQVTANDPDGDQLSFAAVGLPAGLSINSNTGLISGVISASPGVYNVTITVSDDGSPSESASVSFDWGINGENNEVPDGAWTQLGAEPNERLENGYVKVGDKFLLLGGISDNSAYWYDPASNNWQQDVVSLPLEFHHFQPVVIDEVVYIVSAWSGGNNNAPPITHVYMYDPTASANNRWIQGPEIPEARRRGGAGVAVYDGKIYIAGGVNDGHGAGASSKDWFDVFDPLTGTWEILPDMPRVRDHYHGAVIGDKFYAAGGRNTGTANYINATYPEIDVFDFQTQTWSTLSTELPEEGRGGTMTAVLGDFLMVIGGETGQADAHTDVDLLNTLTSELEEVDQLPEGRHGAQAVVCGNSIFIAGGAKVNGFGDETLDQLTYTYGNASCQNLQAVQKSSIFANPNPLDFGDVENGTNTTNSTFLSISGGTQGVIITGIGMSGNNAFDLDVDAQFPIVLNQGQQLQLEVSFNAQSEGTKSAQINISNRGSGGNISIPVVANVLPPENVAPILALISDQENTQGDNVSLQISASDANVNDNLTFQATNLPTGLSLNSLTGLISGSITAAVGTYTVQVIVSDDGDPQLSDSQSFDWTVILPQPNQAPSINPIANQSDAQQSSISLQIVASDTDGDDLTFGATGLPAGLSINTQTGLISGTISANPATYSVEITVTDNGSPNLSDDISFDWEVFIPEEPLTTIWLEAECADFGGDWTVANDGAASEDEFISTQAGFVNDGNINANHIVSIEIQAEEAGSYACWMRIKTSGGFNSLWQGNGNNWSKLDFANYGSWSWVKVNNVNLSVGLNEIQFAKREGSLIDKWVVSSENGFSPSGLGELSQNCGPQPNLAPEISAIGNQTNEEGENISLPIIATDPNGDNLNFQATGLPAGLSINTNTGVISGQLSATAGNYSVTVQVEDDGEPTLSDSESFIWMITEPLPNQAPICTPLPDQSNGQGSTVSLFAEAIDPDEDILTYTAVGLPNGLGINSQTGEISGTVNDELGTYSVVITVQDNGSPVESCSILLDWEVTEVVVNAEVLFVVKGLDLSAGDAAIKDRLETTGYIVTVIDQGDAESSSAEGMGAVIISSTVSSGAINTKFTDVSVPVMTWESYLFDDLGMTGSSFWVDFGNTNGATDITIQDDAHPLAAGLSGTVSLSNSASGLAWGAPNNNAIQLAAVSNNSSQYAIFAYEAGAEMIGMSAPARRVGFGIRDETAAQMTVEGWALFDASVCWLTGCVGQARMATLDMQIENVKAYPNPFLDRLTLEFPNRMDENIEIQIVDMLGRTHFQTKAASLNGGYRFSLNTSSLPEGVYIMYIKSGKQIWRKKLSKK